MTDCIVIGAGYAGLRAAQLLTTSGYTVEVLEARPRIGGRCNTRRVRGEHFDVGGHWIGAHQPRVRGLIEGFGFKFKPQYDEGEHVLDLFGKRYRYTGNISSLNSFGAILEEMGELVAVWDRDMMTIDMNAPQNCPNAQKWDAITLQQWQRENVKAKEVVQLMDFLLWTIFTVPSNEVSYFWWLYYLRGGHGYSVLSDIRGGAQQDKIVGGCQQVCVKMAEAVGKGHIHLSHAVKAIRHVPGGVEVETTKGKRFAASFVINTAPPICCKDIVYDPPLPRARMQLFESYKPGCVVKVYIMYEKRWWREGGLSGELLSDKEPITLLYDATTDTVPALIGFIPAHLGRKWGSVPTEELRAAIIRQVTDVWGAPASRPVDILIRPWMSDEPWCNGAYAGSMGPNTLSRLGGELRRTEGRIHWAGTELATDWVGYFEGAIESGERAAAEVQERLQACGARRSKL